MKLELTDEGYVLTWEPGDENTSVQFRSKEGPVGSMRYSFLPITLGFRVAGEHPISVDPIHSNAVDITIRAC